MHVQPLIESRYDEKRQIYRLVETFVARNNAKQRRGRAGRVQEGLASTSSLKLGMILRQADRPDASDKPFSHKA